jgi:hypothetical protein
MIKSKRPFNFGKGFLGDNEFLGEPLFSGGPYYPKMDDKRFVKMYMKRLLQEFWHAYKYYQELEERQ